MNAIIARTSDAVAFECLSGNQAELTSCVSAAFVRPENDWRLKTVEAIRGTARLPKGGEHWRLQRPAPEVRRQALELVVALFEAQELAKLDAPLVTPTADGGVELRWTNGNRELEFDISPDEVVSWLTLENGRPIDEGSVDSLDLNPVTPRLKWLASA